MTTEIIRRLLNELFPIARSLTGDGNRKTMQILQARIPLEIHEVPSGTQVFDWVVPPEWWINDAWIVNGAGKKIVDWKVSNIHVVNYSTPVKATMSAEELLPRLHSLPGRPEAIPYRTSYYQRDWGFCVADALKRSPEFVGPFTVYIDSGFKEQGSLTFASALHRGKFEEEILISCYCCHPSMANDSLSGVITAALFFEHIRSQPTHYSYRLLIAPETIGAITFLATQPDAVRRIVAGCVVTTTGGQGPLGMKHSFDPTHAIDRLAKLALQAATPRLVEHPFVPDGSDERQFASPAFRIPMVTICKDKYYEYPQYHTSDDNLDFVKPEAIAQTLAVYREWFHLLENNRIYRRTQPACEYQLGKRGLFPNLGGTISQQAAPENADGHSTRNFDVEKPGITGAHLDAFNWIMFGCDGATDVLSIAERAGLPVATVMESCRLFLDELLLEVVG